MVSIRFLQRWAMLDCLYDELYLGDASRYPGQFLFHLVKEASRDPRFERTGLSFSVEKACVVFEGHYECRAIEEFLEVSRAQVFADFATAQDARVWLRWKVQRMLGFTNKNKDLWKDYPRSWPDEDED